MKTPLCSRLLFIMCAAASLLSSGCVTTGQSNVPDPRGVIVEGEVLRSTGSRISHVVPKGGPAGIANDMPGTVTGSRGLEREQNDILPQKPIGGL